MSRDYTTEELILKHRPDPASELEPSGHGQLGHLNTYRLLEEAIEKQHAYDAEHDSQVAGKAAVINKLVAWQVLADAQRAGLKLKPISSLKGGGESGMTRHRPRTAHSG